MHYRIIKKIIGTRKLSTVCELETDSEVLDYCFLKENGILYIEKDIGCISCISPKRKKSFVWTGNKEQPFIQNGSQSMARVKTPCAICHNNKMGFLVEEGGSVIRHIGLKYRGIESFTGKYYKSFFDKYKDTAKNSKIYCAASSKQFVFSVPKLNRLFIVSGGIKFKTLGDGKARFSVSTQVDKSSFNNPSGVSLKGKDLYIADTNNHCIRRFNKNLTVFLGNPVKESVLKSPKRLLINDKVTLVHDDNAIKAIGPKSCDIVYSSDNIDGFVLNDYDLYVWERIND
jgi:hypothetical protein